MLFPNLPPSQQRQYKEILRLMGALSPLFSSSQDVYLDYRMVENLFCRVFEADNVSRSDLAIDAKIGKMGVGIKTFLHKNGKTFEKIAEFNKQASLFPDNQHELIAFISQLRNNRLASVIEAYSLQQLYYHCVTRQQSKIRLFEFPLVPIDIQQLSTVQKKDNIISFHDEQHLYKFHQSKSTLYLQFDCQHPLFEIDVVMLDNPFELLEAFLRQQIPQIDYLTAYLPLYSGGGENKHIPEKSGLNHWNAGGRKRIVNEAYIPIPIEFHQLNPNFLPPRDKSFTLHLPNGQITHAKVCQDNSKALMSNPNSILGEWLLRSVLNLENRQLLTYDRLLRLGIDSVVIKKLNDLEYTIDFAPIGAYDEFIEGMKDLE
ncbi:MAG: NgoFVII family restriction endonuclease [Anaerolineae bacterium]|jgi:hypothetical protein|nr:NgoFVII family restriction endonuclease [Anaerolineae bacterium]